jgi:hypothetical protein
LTDPQPFHKSRYDAHGEIRYMTRSSGYVMCRRPRCTPLVLSEKEWARLPTEPLAEGAEYPTLFMNGVMWSENPIGSRKRAAQPKGDPS